jgi:hypothetical protein
MKSPFGLFGEAADMRLPRFQLSVKRMMIAVLIAAILLGGVTLNLRRDQFLAMAAIHAKYESECLAEQVECEGIAACLREEARPFHDLARSHRNFARYLREHPEEVTISWSPAMCEYEANGYDSDAGRKEAEAKHWDDEAYNYRFMATHRARLKAKCQQAARNAWLSVEPEPPDPGPRVPPAAPLD